jgi:hypothetical protein
VPQMGKFFLCLLADFGEWRGRHQPNKQTKTKIAFFLGKKERHWINQKNTQ